MTTPIRTAAEALEAACGILCPYCRDRVTHEARVCGAPRTRALASRIDQAGNDTERIDWLASRFGLASVDDDPQELIMEAWFPISASEWHRFDLRAAIDAARSKP